MTSPSIPKRCSDAITLARRAATCCESCANQTGSSVASLLTVDGPVRGAPGTTGALVAVGGLDRSARRAVGGAPSDHPCSSGCGSWPSITSRWKASSTSWRTLPDRAGVIANASPGSSRLADSEQVAARSRRAGRLPTPGSASARPVPAARGRRPRLRSPSNSVRRLLRPRRRAARGCATSTSSPAVGAQRSQPLGSGGEHVRRCAGVGARWRGTGTRASSRAEV